MSYVNINEWLHNATELVRTPASAEGKKITFVCGGDHAGLGSAFGPIVYAYACHAAKFNKNLESILPEAVKADHQDREFVPLFIFPKPHLVQCPIGSRLSKLVGVLDDVITLGHVDESGLAKSDNVNFALVNVNSEVPDLKTFLEKYPSLQVISAIDCHADEATPEFAAKHNPRIVKAAASTLSLIVNQIAAAGVNVNDLFQHKINDETWALFKPDYVPTGVITPDLAFGDIILTAIIIDSGCLDQTEGNGKRTALDDEAICHLGLKDILVDPLPENGLPKRLFGALIGLAEQHA
jgi:hypothetical protein